MWTFAKKVIKLWNEKLIYLWNEWEIRGLVLLSLLVQGILIVLGSQRKRTTNTWLRFLVWSAYLSADWIATFALGTLAKTIIIEDSRKHIPPKTDDSIQSFWSPFLLLHLGGPDTITAYSLEDNELWPRHLLVLIIEVGIAFYVSLRSWRYNGLTFIAIPMFIAGIIKYGERNWVLRSSSNKHIRDSLLSAADLRPDNAEFERKKMNGDGKMHDHYLCQAKYLFDRLLYLFADLILDYNDGIACHSMICHKSSEEAFTLVEVELGFLYDVLYTKSSITYSWYGLLFRCISFLSSASALVAFLIIINKLGYLLADVLITYLLLVGALLLEVYALIILIRSDRTKLWLVKHRKSYSSKKVMNVKRWSGTMAQYNLMRFCLKTEEEISIFVKVQKLLGIHETLEKHQNVTWVNVDVKLKDFIFQQLVEKSKKIIKSGRYDTELCKKFLTSRGHYVLEEMECFEIDLKWSIVDVEFDHSLLLWHIATELCYHKDKDIGRVELRSLEECSSISRTLSDYMLYLLVMRPKMLPKGIGELRYRDTCAEAIRFFKQRREAIQSGMSKACCELLGVDTGMSLEEIKGDRTKSVLFYGCRLAKQLQSLFEREQDGSSSERKWEMMNKVWAEMLSYTAIHCGWKEHAKHLKGGGELLSHVCLLMANLGLSDQYQLEAETISQ